MFRNPRPDGDGAAQSHKSAQSGQRLRKLGTRPRGAGAPASVEYMTSSGDCVAVPADAVRHHLRRAVAVDREPGVNPLLEGVERLQSRRPGRGPDRWCARGTSLRRPSRNGRRSCDSGRRRRRPRSSRRHCCRADYCATAVRRKHRRTCSRSRRHETQVGGVDQRRDLGICSIIVDEMAHRPVGHLRRDPLSGASRDHGGVLVTFRGARLSPSFGARLRLYGLAGFVNSGRDGRRRLLRACPDSWFSGAFSRLRGVGRRPWSRHISAAVLRIS
jgi:hypothetical protein